MLPFLDRLVERATDKNGRPRAVGSPLEALTLDLDVLLNTRVARKPLLFDRRIQHESVGRIAASVMNYGTPDLTGPALAAGDVETICDEIRQVLEWFEPRLDNIRVFPAARASDMRQSLHLNLTAQFVEDGTDVEFTIDVETGDRCRIERAASG